MGLYFTLATSPRAASCGTEPASCQGTQSKLNRNLAAPQNSGSKEPKQDTSCPRVTSSECSQISEAYWMPLNHRDSSLSPPLLCPFSFPHSIPWKPLQSPSRSKAHAASVGQDLGLTVALARQSDREGQGMGGTDEGLVAPFHKLR